MVRHLPLLSRAPQARPTLLWCLVTAIKEHPDVNKDDPSATEKFKKLTAAYTRALLESDAREKRAAAGGSSMPRSKPVRWDASQPSRSPPGQVDPRRYNVREWERMHYGMHERTMASERRMSDRARQMQRQARAWSQHKQSPPRPPPRAPFGMFMASLAACATVWTLVFQTNANKFR